MKYRKKPVVIEAIQFVGMESIDKMRDVWGKAFTGAVTHDDIFFYIHTLEGDMLFFLYSYKKPCKHPNCTRNVHARNLCASHYNIVMAYTKTDKSRTCSLENCNNKHRAKGLCIEHADIKYKNGILFQHQDIVSDINESDE